MLRDFFTDLDYPMCELVWVKTANKPCNFITLNDGQLVLALAAFLSLRPTTELGITLGCSGFGFARSTPKLSGYLAGVRRPFVSTLRTFHRPQLTTHNAYDSCTNSK